MVIEELIANKYIVSLLTLVFFFIGAKLVTFIVEKYILKLTAKTKTDVDDLLVKRTHKPVSFLLVILGVKLALMPLGLSERVNMIVQRSISTLSILVLMYILISVINIIVKGDYGVY